MTIVIREGNLSRVIEIDFREELTVLCQSE